MLATTQEFPLHLRAIRSQLQQPDSPLQDLVGFESQDFESLYVEIPTTAAHDRLPQCVSLAFKHQAIKAGMKNSAISNLILSRAMVRLPIGPHTAGTMLMATTSLRHS